MAATAAFGERLPVGAAAPAAALVEQGAAGLAASPGLPAPPAAPFSVFTRRQKWAVTVLASLAGVFGPISSNIYVPSLPQLQVDFARSAQDINLTLTVYLVLQALSPSLFAGLSDSLGRRPVLLACLAIYLCACVGLALTPRTAYWLLLLLRAVQAVGGSPAIGVGSGAIGDVAEPHERGTFMGVFAAVSLLGPAIGPVVGGILVQYLSWRWIFWVLAMLAGATAVLLYIFMPETLRTIVGNGEIPPPLLNARPADILARRRRRAADSDSAHAAAPAPAKRKPRPFASFQMLAYPEILLILAFGSFAFACLFASLTLLSTVLADDYGYDDVKIGLCYLGQGIGCLLMGLVGGRIQDWRFARTKAARGFAPRHARDLAGFPVERCRLYYAPFYMPVFAAAVVGFGWALDRRLPVAVPVLLSALVGMGAQFSTQTCSLLLVDMFPANAGASTAAFNLLRCAVSAVGTAVISPMQDGIGVGWTMTVFAAFSAATLPAVFVLQARGPAWREQRAAHWGDVVPAAAGPEQSAARQEGPAGSIDEGDVANEKLG